MPESPASPSASPSADLHRVLIRGARVVSGSGVRDANVLIEGDRIAAVGVPGDTPHDELIAADGLFLIPGVVDSHVHFREPGADHKETFASGSRAAARGGVTTILDMPNVSPPMTTIARLHERLDRAAATCHVNFGFFIGATTDNLDELKRAERTPGIKIFIGSSTGNLLVDDQDLLEAIFAETTLPICAHCEDESTVRANLAALTPPMTHAQHSLVRNEEAAMIAIRRAVDLSLRHEHPFHVLHLSTAAEVEFLRDTKARGTGLVTGEVCPPHLHFSIDDYPELGARIQINPALKTTADRDRLWDGLHDGTIDAVVTDHAPHTLAEKDQPYPDSPSGLPSVENSLPLMLDRVHAGEITIQDAVRWMCEAPARIWNLAGKGVIEAGADADFALIDMEGTTPVADGDQWTRVNWSPWHGRTLRGAVVRTIVLGRTIYDRGEFDASVLGREVTFLRTGVPLRSS